MDCTGRSVSAFPQAIAAFIQGFGSQGNTPLFVGSSKLSGSKLSRSKFICSKLSCS